MKLTPVTAERATREATLGLVKALLENYQTITITRKSGLVDGKSLSPYFVVQAK